MPPLPCTAAPGAGHNRNAGHFGLCPKPATGTSGWSRLALPAAIAAAGILLVVLNTIRWGPALSPDSAFYVSAARNLLAGRGLVSFDGGPLVAWPPLFPLLLAGLGRLGIEPVAGAWLVNTLAFGIVVFLSGVLLAHSVRDRALVAIGATAVTVSRSFFGTAIVVWTEPVFALFLVLTALFLGRFSTQGRTLDFLPMVTLAALAPLQRYAGIAVIPAVALAILTASELPMRRRLVCSSALCVLSSLPLALWLARNLRLSGTLSGDRPGVFTAVGPTAVGLSQTVLKWFLPESVPKALGPFGVPVVLAAAGVTVWLVVSALRGHTARGRAHVRFALIMLPVYAAGLLAVVSREGLSQLDRLIAPVLFLVALLLAVAAERVILALGHWWGRKTLARTLVITTGVLLLAWPVAQLANATRRDLNTGVGGFESAGWKRNRVITWLVANPVSGRILSNEPSAVYFLTGAEARMSPRRTDDPARLRQTGAVATGTYLVWFSGVNRPYLMTPPELDRQFGLTVVTSTPDGGVAVFR